MMDAISASAIPWISLTVFTPFLGALILMLVPAEHHRVHRNIALAVMSLTFLISITLVVSFDSSVAGYQLTSTLENIGWIRAIGARYHVGIDGISLWLVLLTTFLGPIVVLASTRYITTKVKEFHLALLVLQTAMLGAFVSLDLLLFYMFWELMLIPMYLLIGVWGSTDRIYAAVKLFIYTMVGSVLMLVAILYVYAKSGGDSFALAHMIEGARSLGAGEQRWLFAAFALAFLIKVPLFPLHTWLPDAHVQAPTAGSVVLAGVLLKMGVYGLIRYGMPMFPDAVFEAAPIIAILSVIGIVYGALVAYVQDDAKKLIAYSSVSHLGFCTLGLVALTTESVTGAVFQCLAHGIATSGLFLCIGMLYERRHTRLIADFGGMTKPMPRFAVLFVFIAMASAGVPGLVGFVGEYLILIGSAKSYILGFGELSFFSHLGFGPDKIAMLFVAIAATGMVLGALYLLLMLQKVMFGPIRHDENREVADVSARESLVLVPLVLAAIFMGVQPQIFLDDIEPAVERFIADIEANTTGDRAELVSEHREALMRQQRFDVDRAQSPWEIQGEVGESHSDDSHGEGGHGEEFHGEDSHGEDSHGEDSHGEDSHGSDNHDNHDHAGHNH